MSRKSTIGWAVLVTLVLVFSALSGTTAASHGNTATSPMTASARATDLEARSVNPAPAPFTPLPPAGLIIAPDGSLSSPIAGLTNSQNIWYNFSSSFSGSIIDERNGSVLDGGGAGNAFGNTSGNPVSIMVANATDVQVDDFNVVSGGINFETYDSSVVSFASDNNTLEPADPATYYGTAVGAAIAASANVSLSLNDLNGSVAGLYVTGSAGLVVTDNHFLGGQSGGGDGIEFLDSQSARIQTNTFGIAYTAIFLAGSTDVAESGDSVDQDAVEYGLFAEECTNVSSVESHFQYVEETAVEFQSVETSLITDDNASAPLSGNGIEVDGSTYSIISYNNVSYADAGPGAAGVEASGDYEVGIYGNYGEYDALGIEVEQSFAPTVSGNLFVNSFVTGLASHGNSHIDYQDNGFTSAGFLGIGYSLWSTNDTDGSILYNAADDDGSEAAYGAYAYDDLGVNISRNEFSNNSNIGLTVAASSDLTIWANDIEAELPNSMNSVGLLIVGGTALTVSDNNLVDDEYGVEANGIENSTLSGNNLTGATFDGLYVVGFGDLTVSDNALGDSDTGIAIETGTGLTVQSNYQPAGFGAISGFGITLYLASDALVAYNDVTNDPAATGINWQDGSNDLVLDNDVAGDDDGIWLISTVQTTVAGNDASGEVDAGISFASCVETLLVGDNASDEQAFAIGVQIVASDAVEVELTSVAGDFEGISDEGSSDVTFLADNFTYTFVGLSLVNGQQTTLEAGQFLGATYSLAISASSATTIFHNNFVDVSEWSVVDSTGTLWNASYPTGGNYWGNSTHADTLSGPQQNQPGADGINDTPFSMGPSATDWYPLAYSWTNTTVEVEFTASGLPAFTPWSVDLTYTGYGSGALYGESIGDAPLLVPVSYAAATTFTYDVGAVAGWVATPAAGSDTTTDGITTIAIAWTPFPFAASFHASGIAPGTNWSLTIGASTWYSTSGWINTTLGNGTYTWSARTGGAALATAGGSVAVADGVVTVAVAFEVPTYAVTFVQSGLAAGSTWSVDYDGATWTGTSPWANFTASNGSLTFTVTTTGSQTFAPASGTVDVDGRAQVVPVDFASSTAPGPMPGKATFTVVFTQNGLAAGQTWSVTFNGSTESSSGASISFGIGNGTFAYSVSSSGTVAPSPASGSVTVRGAPTGIAVLFGTLGSGSSSPSTSSGISPSVEYALIAIAVVLGLLAVVGWTRGGGKSGANAPPPTSWQSSPPAGAAAVPSSGPPGGPTGTPAGPTGPGPSN